MSQSLKNIFVLVIWVTCYIQGKSQLSFNMSDTVVTECKGRLFDNGGPGANYSHNANITFTICLNQPAPITISFISFCVEAGFDSLRIFDGPNISSPQLGPTLSGNSVPVAVTAQSGCMTLNFRSDANVACFGWIADWTTEIIPPVPPNITASTALPACEQSNVQVNFSTPVNCDSLHAGVFSLNGPSQINVIAVNPLNCQQGNANGASLTLSPGFNVGGVYNLNYTFRYLDACDSLWIFERSYIIEVFDCPISVEIIAERDSLCAEECTFITAVASGGNGQFSYSWNNGLPPTAGPHLICPSGNITYTVTVDDTSPAFPVSASKTITLFPKTIAGNDISLCQSNDPIVLNGSPAGGVWNGIGITDVAAGIFNPDSAEVGLNEISYSYFYSSTFSCSDTLTIDLRPINAGPDQASCPGAASFPLTGNFPAGGTWSGPYVDANGFFNPEETGIYEITYSFAGCDDSKFVYVDFISNVPFETDSICQSAQDFTFNLLPAGGTWSGNGITDAISGNFSPDEAGGGLHQITYSLNGCAEQFDIYVKPINAGNNFFACPSQDPITLSGFSPDGGLWSGDGIIDATIGIFDPSFNNGNANSTLLYTTPDGCTDEIIARVRQTVIEEELLRFCINEDALILNNSTTGLVPPNGAWIGTGLQTGPENSTLFNPSSAGQGIFTLIYTANTCSDSMQVVVYDEMLIAVNEVCELNPSFSLPVEEYAIGGTFSGSGIVDEINGIFSPVQAGAGTHIITYISPNGCEDQISIEVGNFTAATINSVAPLCFRDTIINLVANPPGGIFSGTGVIGNSFNPFLADEGIHTVEYLIGEGFCQALSSIDIIVFPRVNFNIAVSKDTLCEGEFANISVNAFGGNGGLINYSWNNDLPPVSQQIVSPSTSTEYIVSVSDGCTLINDTINIFVAEIINFDLTVSDIKCFGEPSTASVTLSNPEWNVFWQRGNEIVSGDVLNGQAGTPYSLNIIDMESGCLKDTTFTLPAHPPVIANFNISPNVTGCLEFDQRFVNLIDQSTGGTTGSWDMGDQTSYPYEPNQNVNHEFTENGSFNINLLIFDDNNCKSDYTLNLCINDRRAVYVPNTFTPNGDMINDILNVYGAGIRKIDVYVYDRRGILMAHATELGYIWDGSRPDGRPAMIDVYAYLIELTWENGDFFTKTGTVSLLR